MSVLEIFRCIINFATIVDGDDIIFCKVHTSNGESYFYSKVCIINSEHHEDEEANHTRFLVHCQVETWGHVMEINSETLP